MKQAAAPKNSNNLEVVLCAASDDSSKVGFSEGHTKIGKGGSVCEADGDLVASYSVGLTEDAAEGLPVGEGVIVG